MLIARVLISLCVLAVFAMPLWRACVPLRVGAVVGRGFGLLFTLSGAHIAVGLVAASVVQVPAGSRGVVLRFGGVTGTVFDEGLHFVNPISDVVQMMDVQVHALPIESGAASLDLQDVVTTVTVNYRLDPAKVATIYQDLKQEYAHRIIDPAVMESIKAGTAKYTAEELITKRAEVRDHIDRVIKERVQAHGIIIDAVSITNFRFGKEFTEAIEAKVVAVQTALRAENDLRRIEIEAKQRIATAEAEAKAIEIQAKAIQAQGGSEYVSLKAIEKWDGKLPQWMTAGPVPFVNVPQTHK